MMVAATVLVILKVVEIVVITAMVLVFAYYIYPILKEVHALVVVVKGSLTVTDVQRSSMVDMAEEVKHEAARTRHETQRVAEEVKQVLEQVPDKVVEKIQGSSSDETVLPTVGRVTPGPLRRPPPPPPAPPPQDT